MNILKNIHRCVTGKGRRSITGPSITGPSSRSLKYKSSYPLGLFTLAAFLCLPCFNDPVASPLHEHADSHSTNLVTLPPASVIKAVEQIAVENNIFESTEHLDEVKKRLEGIGRNLGTVGEMDLSDLASSSSGRVAGVILGDNLKLVELDGANIITAITGDNDKSRSKRSASDDDACHLEFLYVYFNEDLGWDTIAPTGVDIGKAVGSCKNLTLNSRDSSGQKIRANAVIRSLASANRSDVKEPTCVVAKLEDMKLIIVNDDTGEFSFRIVRNVIPKKAECK